MTKLNSRFYAIYGRQSFSEMTLVAVFSAISHILMVLENGAGYGLQLFAGVTLFKLVSGAYSDIQHFVSLL